MSRLKSVPSRVSSNDTKFTLARIAELEQPIFAVAKMQQELALARGGGNKRHLEHFVYMEEKLMPPVAEARGDLFFVGVTRAGKFLYERQVAATRPSPFNGGSMKQMSIGAFAARRSSPFF